ncbi:glutamine-hydrolyzing carbamoyl-phosphate synthase small subunit [Mesohalobacter halotolerans]|uniref:Carbamoyl phosphate synthase small chain n=1 Tax=Mesohalobacter halotolerans TaxID=1883405 RepID=A0A4U5TNZ7_9FLAO|nr:glutamine-hydrolyzing carbamoyl-phosphate synthase small subunit [Mesohalobacter halotolerans]MBS3738125.1 glutamine-hydrolyzing carbamoyl-phosphate synthase small subunit [Psychroflexus sp.]TKS55656.1 glutamine-hydrolyzing carbamoyl-phosphate synthase small subunit [Mesohalobacter halotolerans]
MRYYKKKDAILILEDGTQFNGKAVSNNQNTAFGEICFNTGMTGYQEIFTDPSYHGQLMVTTNAHIGNYGVHKEENQSDSPKIAGLICKNFSYNPSRPSSDQSLEEFLNQSKLFAISDIDTRALVRHIRKHGAMNAVISTQIDDIDNLKKKLEEYPKMDGLELASKVSTSKPYFFGNNNSNYKIAVLDLGVKTNILKYLAEREAYLKVFPYNSSIEDLMSFKPDAIFLSNGPGDPQPLKSAVKLAKKAIEQNIPTFGICLGHQVIALSQGISTFKMHHGHRGINHPVMNLVTGKSEITSQNHGFAVNKDEAESHSGVEITHLHLNDQTLAGFKLKGKKCFSVQYHPEAGPGPNDANYLFDDFFKIYSA